MHASADWFTVGATTVVYRVSSFLTLCWRTADHHIGFSSISQRANTCTEVAAASFKELCMSGISKITDRLTPTG